MISLRSLCALVVVLSFSSACSNPDQPIDDSLDILTTVSTNTTLVSSVRSTTTSSVVINTSTTFGPTTTMGAQPPLPNTDLFDAAIKLHTLDAGSRDVSVAVVFQGQVIHTFAASSAKSSRPANVDTNFRIASVSKIVTAN
jgi:CubicO group peptidase (beta-lactamase class C family)